MMTTRYIKVTPEQVEAARIHVQAYRNAGLEPDPVVAKMADAERRRLESAQRQQASAEAKLRQEAKRAERAKRVAPEKAEQEARSSERSAIDAATGRVFQAVERAARRAREAGKNWLRQMVIEFPGLMSSADAARDTLPHVGETYLESTPLSERRPQARRELDTEEVLAQATSNAAEYIGLDTVDPADLLALAEADTQRLARLYPVSPPTEVLPGLVRTQALVLKLPPLVAEPDDQRLVRFLAGIIEGLLGKLCHDFGQPERALLHLGLAKHLADLAHNHDLKAWTLIHESLVSYWAGDARRALNSATEAESVTADQLLRVWAMASQARALALMRRANEVLSIIDKLESLATTLPNSGKFHGFGAQLEFSHRKLGYYIAEALSLIAPDDCGHGLVRAREAVEKNSTKGEEYSFSDEAGARAALALLLVKSGAIREAELALHPVLATHEAMRINGIRLSVTRVLDALPKASFDEEVGGLRERIQHFEPITTTTT